jgi:hypothetical protein
MNRARAYLLDSQYRVFKKDDDELIIETASGRNVFIFLALFVFAFWPIAIFLISLLLAITIWTYQKIWIFNKKDEVIICQHKALWFTVYQKEIQMKDLKLISVWMEMANGDAGSGFAYAFSMTTNESERITIAARRKSEMIKPIFDDVKKMLTENVLIGNHDC